MKSVFIAVCSGVEDGGIRRTSRPVDGQTLYIAYIVYQYLGLGASSDEDVQI